MQSRRIKRLNRALFIIGALIVLLAIALAVCGYVFRDELRTGRDRFMSRYAPPAQGQDQGYGRMRGDRNGMAGRMFGPNGFDFRMAMNPHVHVMIGLAGLACFAGFVMLVGFVAHVAGRRRFMMHGLMHGHGACCGETADPIDLLRTSFAEGKLTEEEFTSRMRVLNDEGRNA